ncbi:replication endonuclease [Salmonella enterica]|nr:replication endonuclease [Salmonella enterica]EDQ4911168.1 replication endonuclease [Salmonella enterica subsp. enterica serovar Gaminara]EGT7823006.1 replication endonuclease [Salmonella enterica]EHU5505679.1 replication endonuclease [Salmonella enterica]EIJ7521973.1 replication endonuclease [Salmonella enterica]
MTTATRGRRAPSPPPPYPGSTDNAIPYAYGGKKPYQPIGVDVAPGLDGFDYLTPDGTRKHIAFSELVAEDEKPERSKLLRRRLASLPQYIRRHFAAKLDALDAKDRKAADHWLVNTFERHVLTRIDSVNSVYQPDTVMPGILLPIRDQLFRMLWAGKKELKRLAYTLADIFTSEFIRESDHQLARTGDPEFAALSGYGRIASLAVHLKTPIPGWTAYCNEELEAEDALRAVLRLESPQWWLNRLRRIHARWREHLMIAAGYVQKKSSPYSSAPCLTEWLAQKKANREYLKAMELEDQDTGERISLIDKVAGSVANPANRRRELMTRMRGFEDLAKLEGLAGDFYTLTAPSRYHAMQHNGRRNNKYCGASPRETQQYLCKVWARTRAAWKRKGIRVFGFRVVEPHHDATPHWHLLLFMRPEKVEQARDIFRKYALREDGNEPGAWEHRLEFKPIEDALGSATGYIAKYISKNIDGFALDGEKDDETGEDLKEMSLRVSAWASRWSIRQFQQIGGAPVTVYRELRRLGNRELVLHPELETARQAADAGEWDNYVLAQGGPLVERDNLRIRLNYETTENGNAYGDDVQRITGIYCPITGNDSLIFTRTTQYKIVPKRQSADGVAVDVGFSGGNAAPRSSVNNCTRDPAAGADGLEHADHEVSETVNFEALSRQEKRELAQRLKEDLKRTRKKLSHQRQEGAGLSIKEKHIHELLSLRGVDASAAMVRSLIAGSSLACGDQVMSISNGKLKSSSRAGSGIGMLPTQMKEIKDKTVELINRWKRVLTVCSSKPTG